MTQDHQEHIVVEPDGFFPLCGKSEPSVQGPVGAGREQCEDVRKGLRDSGLFSEMWGRLREASFAGKQKDWRQFDDRASNKSYQAGRVKES